MKTTCLSICLLCIAPFCCFADVIINEIQYHPEPDEDNLEYVELFNTSEFPIDLTNWKFTDGIEFTFPAGTVIPEQGYLVLTKNKTRFVEHYGPISAPLIGDYKGKLSNSGETLELKDAQGTTQQKFKYEESWPWNPDADGSGRSLERISTNPILDFRNWQASGIDLQSVTGTPGRVNSAKQATLPPFIYQVEHGPIVPKGNEPVTVYAEIETPAPSTIFLWYNPGPRYEVLEMKPATDRVNQPGKLWVTATIPGQKEGTLVRYYVHLAQSAQAVRRFPIEAPQYGRGWRVLPPKPDGLLRDEFLLDPLELQKIYNNTYDLTYEVKGSFIADGVLYDYVTIRLRGGSARDFPKKNWRVNFPKSNLLNQKIQRLNVNSDYHDASHMRNVLSMELFEMLGFPVQKTAFTRAYFNGSYGGLFYRLENVDTIWLEDNGRDPDADTFKASYSRVLGSYPIDVRLWFEKKSGPDGDYASIASLYDFLWNLPYAQLGAYLEGVFDMDSLYNYMIGRTLLSNHDDRYKNFYLHLDRKWEFFPHDLDLSWGHEWRDEGGLLNKEFSVSRPILFLPNEFMIAILYDPVLWDTFLKRLRPTINQVLEEDVWWPRIDAYAAAIRSAVQDDRNKWETMEEFDQEVQRLKNYVTLRREFLLKHELPPETAVWDWQIMP